MYLESLHGTDIEIIPITPQPGIDAIAFTLKEVVDGWDKETEELVMDSTCKQQDTDYESLTHLLQGRQTSLDTNCMALLPKHMARRSRPHFCLPRQMAPQWRAQKRICSVTCFASLPSTSQI